MLLRHPWESIEGFEEEDDEESQGAVESSESLEKEPREIDRSEQDSDPAGWEVMNPTNIEAFTDYAEIS